jgi:hypothetical protein
MPFRWSAQNIFPPHALLRARFMAMRLWRRHLRSSP